MSIRGRIVWLREGLRKDDERKGLPEDARPRMGGTGELGPWNLAGKT